MSAVYEVDYTVKDNEKWKNEPKDIPTIVVADSIQDAVAKASEFNDDNITLYKCNILYTGKVALPSNFSGLSSQKAAAQESA